MKKVLLFAAGLIVVGFMSSCEEDCKECFIRTTGTDGVTTESETTPVEYCGENLTEKENSEPDEDPSGVVTEYVCE